MIDTRFPVSIHIMTGLANHQPNLVSSGQLALSIKTNASFVRKLVVGLTAAGLVESVRGKTGGIRLARPPKEISLAQIYRAVTQNALVQVPAKSPHKGCAVSCGMGAVLHEIARDIEENTLRQLEKKKLSEVLARVKRVKS